MSTSFLQNFKLNNKLTLFQIITIYILDKIYFISQNQKLQNEKDLFLQCNNRKLTAANLFKFLLPRNASLPPACFQWGLAFCMPLLPCPPPLEPPRYPKPDLTYPRSCLVGLKFMIRNFETFYLKNATLL